MSLKRLLFFFAMRTLTLIEVIKMAKKKKINGFTEEEWKRIEEEAYERVRKDRIIEAHQERVNIIPELLQQCLYKSRLVGSLDRKFILNLYKFLINNSDLTEEEKDHIEFLFAEDYLFVGRGGVPEGISLQELIDKMRKALKPYRET